MTSPHRADCRAMASRRPPNSTPAASESRGAQSIRQQQEASVPTRWDLAAPAPVRINPSTGPAHGAQTEARRKHQAASRRPPTRPCPLTPCPVQSASLDPSDTIGLVKRAASDGSSGSRIRTASSAASGNEPAVTGSPRQSSHRRTTPGSPPPQAASRPGRTASAIRRAGTADRRASTNGRIGKIQGVAMVSTPAR